MSSQNISLAEGYFTPSVVNRHYSGNLIYTAIVYGDEPDEIFLLIDDTKFFLTKIDQTYLDGAIKITYQLEIDAQTLISRLTEDDVYRIFIGYLDIYQNGLRTVRSNVFLQVWDETIPLVEVKETVNGLFFTQNIVNVISDNALTAFEAVRTVYNDFTDDYDYICLVDVPGFFANSSFTMVSNDVQGIGHPIYNSSTNWGSEGRLKGIVKIALPNLFDEANYILLHEIGHSWINYLENTPYEIAIFHWPFGNKSTSIMGISIGGKYGAGGQWPFDLNINNNEFSFVSSEETVYNGLYFKDIDLYLMGLISPSQVTDSYLFRHADSVPVPNFIYNSSDFIKFSINELIGIVGERIPSHENSQKNFKVLTIIASKTKLTEEEYAFYDYFAKRAELREPVKIHVGFVKGLGLPFFLATNKLATIESTITFSNKLSITPQSQYVQELAGSVVFQISSNTTWEVTNYSDWLTITPTKGNGNGSITVSYTANPTINERVGTITLWAADVGSKQVSITQHGISTLSVNPSEIIDEGCNNSTYKIDISSNSQWAAHIDPYYWGATISPLSGEGNGSIMLSLPFNYSADRSAKVVIELKDGFTETVNVLQYGYHWFYVPTNIDLSAEASSKTFSITQEASATFASPWSITENADWLTLSPSEGEGSANVNLSVAENTTTETRSEIIKITGCRHTYELLVTQEGLKTLSVNPSNQTVGAQAGTTTFSISSTTNWTISHNETWLTVNPVSGSGNGTITATVTANPLIIPRLSTIKIEGTAVNPAFVTVNQEGSPPILQAAPTSIQLGYQDGSTGSFNISSNINWQVTNSEGWLTLSKNNGSGDDNITITAQKNPTVNQRTANITINGTGVPAQTVSILVNQEGSPPILQAAPTSIQLGYQDGSTGSFNISSNINWQVTNSEGWLTLSKNNGSGDDNITITAQKNPTVNQRTANITINGTGVPAQIVSALQEGSPTGIDEFYDEILIYPNPADSRIFIKGLACEALFRIYDVSGRICSSDKLVNNNIDITNIPSGVYMVVIECRGTLYQFSFVKH